jgi:hypothetical protein
MCLAIASAAAYDVATRLVSAIFQGRPFDRYFALPPTRRPSTSFIL